MKLFKISVLLSTVLLLTTGCDISTESPEQLAKKPISNQENEAIFNIVREYLPQYTTFTNPDNINDVGRINRVDLDSDGADELIAFKEKDNLEDSKQVGFMIISESKEGNYIDRGSFLELGESISYANFKDLDNDGYKEIILVTEEELGSNMYIYRYKDDQIKRICKLNPYWIKYPSDFSDLKISIGNIYGDDKDEILIMNHNRKTNELCVAICNFDESMNIIDYTIIEDVKDIDSIYTYFGQVSPTKEGIIIDTINFSDNYYSTQILYLDQNNELHKAFKEKNLAKSYYIPVEDMNNDNILDIPIVKNSKNQGVNNYSNNIDWYNWNGKDDDKSSEVFVSRIYYNYKYNFMMSIPNNLVDKVYVEEDDSQTPSKFNFHYYDVVDKKPKILFSVVIGLKSNIEDKNISLPNSILLGENKDYKFILDVKDQPELEKLNITTDALTKYFSLIY